MRRSPRSSDFVPRANKGRNERCLPRSVLVGGARRPFDCRGYRRAKRPRRLEPRQRVQLLARAPRKRPEPPPRSKAPTPSRNATSAKPSGSTHGSSPRISTWAACTQEHANEDPDAARKGLATYRALLDVAPSNAEALYQAGYLAACAAEWSSSRAWLERLPPDAQSRPQVLVLLAIDFAALAEPKRASEAATALLAHPDLAEEDMLAAAPAFDRSKDAALEAQLFGGLDARRLASMASLRRLGDAEMRLGHLDAARAALERAAAASPATSVPILLDLARVAYKQKDYEGALGYLAHARKLRA